MSENKEYGAWYPQQWLHSLPHIEVDGKRLTPEQIRKIRREYLRTVDHDCNTFTFNNDNYMCECTECGRLFKRHLGTTEIPDLDGDMFVDIENENHIVYIHLLNEFRKECIGRLKSKKIKLIGFDPENKEECIEAVKQNGYALKYVKDQTPEICIEAVKEDGRALQYVKEQTPEICMEAVKQNGYALKYVKDQTPEICMEAVKQNGEALQYVKDQTPEICIEAVKQNGYALKYVKDVSMLETYIDQLDI